MNCPNCHAELPEGAKFCYACGRPVTAGAPAASTPPPPPPPPSAPAVGANQLVKCPACGAPLSPVFGEMVISCDYCGGSVTLGGAGWKEIDKHTILAPKILTAEAALRAVHDFLDVGLLHRKAFEESTITEQKLSFVPFWIVPVSASTNFVYTDVAISVGSTAASIAAAEVLGSALGGRRGGGGFIPIPIMTGSPVNASRQDTITGQYEFPVVAVKSMSAYQPKDYKFALEERSFFDKKVIPTGSPVLNGDLGEDAAQHSARAFVTQLQTEQAHKKHYMVSQLNCEVQAAAAELLHVPIWYFMLDRKGAKAMILVDGHAGRVMQTVA
jgi:hypothetical protein